MSIYLKKIELTGFRGALLPVEIEVAKDKGCVVLYGENGCGKTTFTEAIEWYYYDKIEYLEKEFCKKESYFNTNLADNQGAEVLLNYSLGEYNSLKILPRKSPSYHVNKKPEFKQYIERSRRENFILRHHNLKEFVDDKSKKEKLEHFAKLIGLEKITEIREILLQSYNTIKDSKNFAKLKGQLDEVRKNLKDNFEIEIYDLQNIILYTNRKIKTIYPNKTIKSLDDIKTVQEDLEIAGKSSELQTKIQQLSSIKDNLIKYKNIIVVLRNISEWINGYHSFVSESGIIQQNSLLRLYKIGKSLLSSKEWEDKETCPLCGSKIDGTQLIKHLREEIEKLDSLSKDKATQEENLKKQLNSLTIETNNLKILRGIINDNINQNKFIETESKELIAKIDSFESDILTIAPSLEQSFEALTNPVINIIQIIGKAEDINNLTTRISSLINNEIITLGQSPNSINYLEIASQLKSLTTLFKRLQDLESEIEKYVISYTSIKRILDKFEEEEKSIFEKVIDSISSDIDLYYNILNPDEGIKEISLFPTDDIGAERGIEITYEFHGMKQFPARKYLSESHRNALGLSIFLASGRYFNHINKFLILDDIYTSLDINHRERLITLFTHPSLADLQFFITTHDIIWFKTMQRALQSETRWQFKEIRKWEIDSGIEISEAPESIRARIIKYVDGGDSFAGCKTVRSYYEEILKRLAKKLEIRVPYKETALWEPRELYSGITEKIKNSNIPNDIRFRQGDPAAFLANLFAHENDVSVSSGTVRNLVEMIDEFYKAFFCNVADCKKPVWNFKKTNGSGFQCQCGALSC